MKTKFGKKRSKLRNFKILFCKKLPLAMIIERGSQSFLIKFVTNLEEQNTKINDFLDLLTTNNNFIMSKVNSYMEHHGDFGPWKQTSQQYQDEAKLEISGKKMLHLPRMTKKSSDMEAKNKGTKYMFDLPMKINPINL